MFIVLNKINIYSSWNKSSAWPNVDNLTSQESPIPVIIIIYKGYILSYHLQRMNSNRLSKKVFLYKSIEHQNRGRPN